MATMVEEINQIVQNRLAQSQISGRSMHLRSRADLGVEIVVDGKVYQDLSEIDDIAVRDLIQASINEWRAEQATTPSAQTEPLKAAERQVVLKEGNNMSTKWNRAIAVLEMIGGVFGVLVSIGYLYGASLNLIVLLITALFIGLYVLSFVAGWYLWKNDQRGFSLSMLVQALQIPQISVPGLTYLFVSPLDISFVVRADSWPPIGSNMVVGPNFYLPSSWSLFLGGTGEPFLLGVNVLTLVCFFYLHKQSKSLSAPLVDKSEQEMVEAPNERPDMVEVINQNIQKLLAQSAISDREVKLRSRADLGVEIVVDGEVYQDLSEIDDITVRDLIQASIGEWDAEQVPTSSTMTSNDTRRRKLRGIIADVVLGRKKRRGIIAGVVLVGLCLCAVLYASLFSTSAEQQDEWLVVTDAFMRAMANKDPNKAYALFSTQFQNEYPVSELEAFLNNPMFALFDGYLEMEISAWEISSTLEGKFVALNGTVTYESGYSGSFDAVLAQERDEWKLNFFNVTVPPDKFENYQEKNNP